MATPFLRQVEHRSGNAHFLDTFGVYIMHTFPTLSKLSLVRYSDAW